jgi:hypothetical protein
LTSMKGSKGHTCLLLCLQHLLLHKLASDTRTCLSQTLARFVPHLQCKLQYGVKLSC